MAPVSLNEVGQAREEKIVMREVAVIAGWKIPAPVPPITVDPEPTKMADEGAKAFSQIF